MKRLPPSFLYLLFAFVPVIPAWSQPPLATRPGASMLPALPRLSALPGLPPDSTAPREGQGGTEREFYELLRNFESWDECYRMATRGSPAQRVADQNRRELYDRGIGILTREGALLDSSPNALEYFALHMDLRFAATGVFTLREQLYGYATMYAWRAFSEMTRLELEHETDRRRLLGKADAFAQSYTAAQLRRERGGDGWPPPSPWQMNAYAAVRDCAYQAAGRALEWDSSGSLSWRDAEDLAYGLEPQWLSTRKGSAQDLFYYRAMTAAFEDAFSLFERELVSGQLAEADLAAALERAEPWLRKDSDVITYATRIRERIGRHRASGR